MTAVDSLRRRTVHRTLREVCVLELDTTVVCAISCRERKCIMRHKYMEGALIHCEKRMAVERWCERKRVVSQGACLLGILAVLVLQSDAVGAASVHKSAADALKAAGLDFYDPTVSSSGTVRRVERASGCSAVADPQAGGGDANGCRALGPGSGRRVDGDPFIVVEAFTGRGGRQTGLAAPPSATRPMAGLDSVVLMLEGTVVERTTVNGAEVEIGPGDIRWLAAAGGIMSEQRVVSQHAKGVHVLLNVPERERRAPTRVDVVSNAEIPIVDLHAPAGRATARLIAGSLVSTRGPASTERGMLLADVTLMPNTHVHVPILRRHGGFIFVISGEGFFGGDVSASPQGEAHLPATGKSLGKRGSADEFLWLTETAKRSDATDPVATDDLVFSTLGSRVRFLLCMAEPLRDEVVIEGSLAAATAASMRELRSLIEAGSLGYTATNHRRQHADEEVEL